MFTILPMFFEHVLEGQKVKIYYLLNLHLVEKFSLISTSVFVTTGVIVLVFFIHLSFHEKFKLILSFLVGAVRHARAYINCTKITNDQYFKEVSCCFNLNKSGGKVHFDPLHFSETGRVKFLFFCGLILS